MSFRTPRLLSRMAAKVFVENFILDNHIFFNFQFSKTAMKSFDSNHLLEEKTVLEFELSQLKTSVNEIAEVMDTIFKRCKEPKALECILQELRTTDHHCSSGTLILLMLFDTEIHFRSKHWKLFSILLIMDRQFPLIQKLVFDMTDHNSAAILGQLIPFLPNLNIFKGTINKEGKSLNILRKHCPRLTELSLYIKDGYISSNQLPILFFDGKGCFSSNQLSTFFFAGKTIDDVKKAFVMLQSIELSFPNLTFFSINCIGYDQYDFFKMFLHFYSNVNLDIGLHYSQFPHCVSWFDAVLSHTVVLHPDLRLNQCDLNVYDLYLPFCESSLNLWQNLECVTISLGIQGKKNPATSSNIGKRLEFVLTNLKNLKELCIRVQGPLSEDDVIEMVGPTLKEIGKKLNTLKIIGILHYLSHRSLVNAVNLCSGIKDLVLVGKRINKYFKDVKVTLFESLESLTVLWSESQTNNAYCQWISKLTTDLIRNAPNLKKLFITVNSALLDSLSKITFGSKLETLLVYFHTETSFEGVEYFRKFLPQLSNLKLIVVKEIQNDEPCSCEMTGQGDDCDCHIAMDASYSAIKSVVDNTEIYVRYFSLEDAGTHIIL